MIRQLRNFSSKKLWAAFLLLGSLVPGLANATYTPVVISSGYNADVVANGTGDDTLKTTAAFDAVTGGYNLMTLGYNNGSVSSTTGLPLSGLINSFTNAGLSYQMADFDSLNSLRITASATPGTLTFATPTAAGEVYLLISSGGGAGTVDVTVNFSNSTSQTFTGQSVADWYNGSNYAVLGLGRVQRSNNAITNDASNPRLYDMKLVLSPANWGLTIVSVTVTRTSASGIINVMGVSLNDACSGTPNAGTTVVSPMTVCPSTSFTVSTTGASTSVGRTYQWYSSPAAMNTWTAIAGATNASYTEALGVLLATDYRRMDSCTISGLTGNSTTLTITPSTGLPGGTYTIDPSIPASATNFQSFTAAVDAMRCGILGNIVMNVAANKSFTEQVTLPASINASASQTVTFNCSNDTLKWTGTSALPYTLGLNGADFITFNNLVVIGNDATYALVAHLWNAANYNTFKNCSFLATANTTSTTSIPFSISGTANSGTSTTAPASNYNTIDSCTMFSGYYGVTMYGTSATVQGNGNRLMNSTIRDFYFYGNYNSNQDSVEISNNIFERPTRTTLSSFYGIYVAAGNSNALVQKNRLRNQFGGNPTYAGVSYNIYVNSTTATVGNENKVFNNLISNLNGNSSAYGLYLPSATNIQVYHNTVSMDNSSATTGTVYALYTTGSTNIDIKNNNISVTQGGTGTKYCMYFSTVTGKTSNYNNLYMGSTTGTNNIGYAGSVQATFAAWQTVNSNAFDQNGSNQNPMFAAPAAGNFAPTNAAMDNLATPLASVTDDITGAPRNAVTPDMGAYEFSVAACTGTPNAGTAFAAANVCPSVSFTVNDTGFTIASGMTYQWQDSSSISGTWADIIGATNISYTATAGITIPTSYRMVMTCTNSFLMDTTNQVNVGLNSFMNCYCTSTATSTADEEIMGITIGSLTNNSTCTSVGCGPGSTLNLYSNYSGCVTIPNLMQGALVPFSLTLGYCGTFAYSNTAAIYIDFNHNGILNDPGETVYTKAYGANTLPSQTFNSNFTVPITADTGLTRMRIVYYETSVVSPCGTPSSWGETEDYDINITAAVGCVGTPSAGVAYGPSMVCSASAFTINDSAMTTGIGINYQWQDSSSVSGAWADILNATNVSYTATAGITVPTSYRMVITCTNSFLMDTSNVQSVALDSFYKCYCSPLTGVTLHTCCGNYISNVTITGTTLNNSSTTNGPGYYTQYLPNVPSQTGTVVQGLPYTYNTTLTYSSYGADIWIDINGNGIFESTEYYPFTGTSTAPTNLLSQSIAIPTTSVTGLTGMRVRQYYPPAYGAGNACQNYGSGYETEDYVINILAAPTCSGTPAAGVAYGPANACPSQSFTVLDSAFSFGMGITYQWQDSSSVSGAWADILNATSPNYTASAGITVPTSYRMIIVCTNSFASDTSNVWSVGLNSFLSCYCASSAQYTNDEEILNVTFGGLNNSSTCTTTAPGPGSVNQMYSNYTTLPATNVMLGAVVPFSVQIGTCGGNYGNMTKIFIDYNQNGVFEPLLGEEAYVSPTSTNGAHTESGSITIPLTADTGLTMMRVVTKETSSAAAVTACGVSSWGETEDYYLYVSAAVSCTGTPNAGVVYAASAVCPSQTFNVNDSAYSSGMGITYQWQDSSSVSGAWADILGATNPSYSNTTGITVPTSYRMIATCTNSFSMDTSNVWNIGVNPFFGCYCTSNATSTADEEILGFTLGSLTTTSTCSTTGCGSGSMMNQYSNYAGCTIVPIINRGDTVSFALNLGYCGSTAYSNVATIYIDYNQNGLYTDPGEAVYTKPYGAVTITGQVFVDSFVVPITANTGNTGMRIVYVESSVSNPCGTYGWGETEDYVVNIDYPLAIKLSDISAINQGAKNRVDWSTEAELKGDVFELERSMDGVNYETIYVTAAKGAASRYSYTDNSPFAGVNYYRLKLKQTDGTQAYSKVVTATVSGSVFAVQAFPNPVANELTVKVNGMMAADATVQLTDLTGKVITTVQLSGATTTIDMKGLANGVYLVKYTDANHTQTIRVTKQ